MFTVSEICSHFLNMKTTCEICSASSLFKSWKRTFNRNRCNNQSVFRVCGNNLSCVEIYNSLKKNNNNDHNNK